MKYFGYSVKEDFLVNAKDESYHECSTFRESPEQVLEELHQTGFMTTVLSVQGNEKPEVIKTIYHSEAGDQDVDDLTGKKIIDLVEKLASGDHRVEVTQLNDQDCTTATEQGHGELEPLISF